MRQVPIIVGDDFTEAVETIERLSSVTLADMSQKIVNKYLQEAIIEELVSLYKNGKLKAAKAWKLSGLSLQEFQNRAT